MTLSQRLSLLRKMRNLTQEELASKTGIPNSYISRMETGKIIPAGEWEDRLRTALNWTPDVDAQLDSLIKETVCE